jgi:predicted DCC family thiol-disulfide oxidoreductase YuxK
MKELTVLYDASCALCVRCRDWLATQPSFVPLRFVATVADEAQARYGSIPWLGEELVVVSDEGDVWAGPSAFLVSLWALEAWREWSFTMASAPLTPLVERFFGALSSRRRALSAFLKPDPCTDGTCRAPYAHRTRHAYR